MKRLLSTLVALVLLAGVGVAVYPSAHASIVRRRATAHVREAGALQQEMKSPIARMALSGVSDRLRFAVMRPDTPVEDIARADDALARLMASLRASPPPDNPVIVTATVEPGVTAGETVTVRVSLHSLLPEVFLVNVTAQVVLQQGWQSNPVRQAFNRVIDATPVETSLEFKIPADVAGPARVRATVTYRLDPTGEGIDLRAQPAALPELTIVPIRK